MYQVVHTEAIPDYRIEVEYRNEVGVFTYEAAVGVGDAHIEAAKWWLSCAGYPDSSYLGTSWSVKYGGTHLFEAVEVI